MYYPAAALGLVTAFSIVLCLGLMVAVFVLPLKYAFAPFVLAACTLPDLVILDVGPNLTLTRMLILACLLRATLLGQLRWSPRNPVDLLFAAWAVWAVLSAFGHNPKGHNPFTVRASMAFDFLGPYIYARTFLFDHETIVRFSKFMVLCMVVLAGLMAYEKATTINIPWTIAAGNEANALSREGRVRAGGPFKHPILAGTVGACSAICMAFLFREKQRRAALGLVACGVVVYSSASSGPIMTLAVGLGALAMWRWRSHLRTIRSMAILAIIALHVVMNAPVWYLIARLDLAGGSTGWHRAELISKALEHFDRWWLMGTDYTRDWFYYGIAWDSEMVDITNLYIQMGVRGGLLLMLLFIAILLVSFRMLGKRMAELRFAEDPNEFRLWCFGSALFAHCVTFISVTYFDQSVAFSCIVVGAVPGLCATPISSFLQRNPPYSFPARWEIARDTHTGNA